MSFKEKTASIHVFQKANVTKSFLALDSALKCDVIRHKNHVPMGTTAGKVPNYAKGTYIACGLSAKKIGPGVPLGDPKSPKIVQSFLVKSL